MRLTVGWLTRRWMYVLLAATSFYFLAAADPNQVSRLLLTEAIALEGRPDITERHGATIDKGEYDGRYFSDKAPGVSLLAVPLYGLMRAAERVAGLDSSSRPVARARVHVLVFLLAGLPATLTAALLARALRRLGTSPGRADGLACAFGLGTIVFPYGLVLYGHALAALLLFSTFIVVMEWDLDSDGSAPLSSSSAFGLGALAATAVVVEYPMALPCAIALSYALARTPRTAIGATVARMAAGAFAPIAVHMAFATWAFGSPLALPYRFVVEPFFRAHVSSGLFGIGVPIPAAIYGTLVSSYRGLFFFCPITALVFAGYGAWVDRAKQLRVAALTLAITLAGLVFTVSYYAWDGGLSTGSRHLVPYCAFLVLPLGMLVERSRLWRVLASGLAVLSALVLVAMVAVSLQVPEEDVAIGNPLYSVALPHLMRGELGIFFGDFFGAPSRGDVSGTLASAFGAPAWLSLAIPIVAWGVSGGLVLVLRLTRLTRRTQPASAAGSEATR